MGQSPDAISLTCIQADADRIGVSVRCAGRWVGEVVADPARLPVADAAVHTLLLGACLEHERTPLAVLTEADRVLQPTGCLRATLRTDLVPGTREGLAVTALRESLGPDYGLTAAERVGSALVVELTRGRGDDPAATADLLSHVEQRLFTVSRQRDSQAEAAETERAGLRRLVELQDQELEDAAARVATAEADAERAQQERRERAAEVDRLRGEVRRRVAERDQARQTVQTLRNRRVVRLANRLGKLRRRPTSG